ncbi:MAG: hypothetical protein K2G51_04180 [Lachnospiraceae bacterium]|nr:hypothetical protein [Lachnospiraceae bacterium]
MKNNNDLFFVCSLIEYIARKTKNRRYDVVMQLGNDIQQIYEYADIFHCESIEKVADDFIQKDAITEGNYDNLINCKYTIPDYWDIGEVFARLIEDCYGEEEVVKGINEVYRSWLADRILMFNSDLYYQSREYIAVCYKEGELLLA